MANKNEIHLGDTAKDTITGYEGVVVARTLWLHGCERITIQSRELKDGKPVDSCTFDVEQVELVQSVRPREVVATGGPKPEPVRQPDITR